MEDISLHILDIVENSISAEAKKIIIKIEEDIMENKLILEIEDDGRGIPSEFQEKVKDPFFTTKKNKKVGLGLALLEQSVEEANGNLYINSIPGKGTKLKAIFTYNHIDRKPLGNINETLETLFISHPEINFIFEYKSKEGVYKLNSNDFKKVE